MNYQEYLESPLWKRIRERVLRRDRYRCRSCGVKATEVHHERYTPAVMRGHDDSPLLSLCRQCHEATTFTAWGSRRPAGEVREMAFALKQTPRNRPKKGRRPKRRHLPPRELSGLRFKR